MFGERNDLPHRAAYEGASFLLAYYPAALEAPNTPAWIREKTLYLDFFSQFSQPSRSFEPALNLPNNYWLYLQGFGGSTVAHRYIKELAEHFPKQEIVVVGPSEQQYTAANLRYTGTVPSIAPYVRGAELVFGACGSNTTAELATLGAPFIAIPEERPFKEQEHLAEALERQGLARVWRDELATEIIKRRPVGGYVWAPFVRHNAVDYFYNWIQPHREELRQLEERFPIAALPKFTFSPSQTASSYDVV
jgi:UDP:flavonoid glycosyltransferase YjiC (YdhE family)